MTGIGVKLLKAEECVFIKLMKIKEITWIKHDSQMIKQIVTGDPKPLLHLRF